MTRLQKTFALMAVLAVVFVATACVPPNPGPGQGKASFDYWASTNVQTIHADLSPIATGQCAITDYNNNRVYIDDAGCVATNPDPRWPQFALYHEYAHVLDGRKLGFARGVGSPIILASGTYYPRLEESAQCIAEVVLGYSMIPPMLSRGAADTLGYWDCPDAEVARFRAAMTVVGVL